MEDKEKIKKAREFCERVKELSKEYNLPFFLVTDGASIISNNGCEAVKHARECHVEWEKKIILILLKIGQKILKINYKK